MPRKVNLALIGYGYWGPNLLRNFYEVEDCQVTYCADIDKQRLNQVKRRYPQIVTTTNYREILSNKKIHAIVIATPVATHYPIAKEALEARKDVLIEKPMTDSFEKAWQLANLARKKKLILMVDHTFIYTPAVRWIKEIIDRGTLGKLLYVDSVRIALGLFQHDINVIYDLASHDFAIIDYLFSKEPTEVMATGAAHFGTRQENLAYVLARYPGNFLVHTHVSWLSPVKSRTMIISGVKKMIVYDDVEPADKVRMYDKGVIVEKDPDKIYQARIGYRLGDLLVPHLTVKEALANVANHFIKCVKMRKKPDSDGEVGARVVKIVESATKSLRGGGKAIRL